MILEDVKLGMKVVPHNKRRGCSYVDFMETNTLHRKNENWLYVIEVHDNGDISLSPEMHNIMDATFFIPEDFEPWCDTEDIPVNKDGTEKQADPVNHPSHYTSGEIECIDAIKASMTKEAFLGFLKGNQIKYLWRYEKKINPLEDIKKAGWYRDILEKELQDAL